LLFRLEHAETIIEYCKTASDSTKDKHFHLNLLVFHLELPFLLVH